MPSIKVKRLKKKLVDVATALKGPKSKTAEDEKKVPFFEPRITRQKRQYQEEILAARQLRNRRLRAKQYKASAKRPQDFMEEGSLVPATKRRKPEIIGAEGKSFEEVFGVKRRKKK